MPPGLHRQVGGLFHGRDENDGSKSFPATAPVVVAVSGVVAVVIGRLPHILKVDGDCW